MTTYNSNDGDGNENDFNINRGYLPCVLFINRSNSSSYLLVLCIDDDDAAVDDDGLGFLGVAAKSLKLSATLDENTVVSISTYITTNNNCNGIKNIESIINNRLYINCLRLTGNDKYHFHYLLF